MTVKELIEKLQAVPNQDADVIYRCCSDWSLLEEREVEFLTADQSKAVVDAKSTKYPDRKCTVYEGSAVQYRGGRYQNAYTNATFGPDEAPQYRDVLTLPGN